MLNFSALDNWVDTKQVSGKVGVRHISSIDGLRAIAVAAVVLYHLGISWIPGGFLGVDLFFVISGYVITRLILDSINQSSALDLRAFYAARLRETINRVTPEIIAIANAILATFFFPKYFKTVNKIIGQIKFLIGQRVKQMR